MRTPDHLAIKNNCRESIAGLMAKHKLGVPEKVVLDEHGWVNPCFFVNDKLVFRFNARDTQLPKFQREKLIFDLLENSSLPTPRQVFLDESREAAPYDVLISPMLPGSNVEQDWPTLPAAFRQQLAEGAGKLLTKLHEITFPFFGELAGRGPLPQTEQWMDYLLAVMSFQWQQAVELGIFDAPFRDRFMDALQSRGEAVHEVTSARLVHYDFHLGNLLHVGAEITGLLDFEWSFAGDPLYDLFDWYPEAEQWPGSRTPFLRGYGKLAFSVAEIRRLEVYQMLNNITLCVVARQHFPAEEALQYREATWAHLYHLEKS